MSQKQKKDQDPFQWYYCIKCGKKMGFGMKGLFDESKMQHAGKCPKQSVWRD